MNPLHEFLGPPEARKEPEGIIENWDFLPSLLKEDDLDYAVYKYVKNRFITWEIRDHYDVVIEIEDKLNEMGYDCYASGYFSL